jgi:hypothetical protein
VVRSKCPQGFSALQTLVTRNNNCLQFLYSSKTRLGLFRFEKSRERPDMTPCNLTAKYPCLSLCWAAETALFERITFQASNAPETVRCELRIVTEQIVASPGGSCYRGWGVCRHGAVVPGSLGGLWESICIAGRDKHQQAQSNAAIHSETHDPAFAYRQDNSPVPRPLIMDIMPSSTFKISYPHISEMRW